MGTRSLLWLRRDFRIDDHPALHEACRDSAQLILVWIDDPEDPERYGEGAASRWWLARTLREFDRRLRPLGQQIHLFRGKAVDVLQELCRCERVTDLYAHRRHEPMARTDEDVLSRTLPSLGTRFHLIPDAYFHEPMRLLTDSGRAYRVFTPFWRQLVRTLDEDPPHALDAPRSLPSPWILSWTPNALPTDILAPSEPSWSRKFSEYWQPGELSARQRIQEFLARNVTRYAQARHRLDLDSTSRLSPHLHFGELSVRRIDVLCRSTRLEQPESREGVEAFRRQLGWREFGRHLLVHDPEIVTEPFDRRYRDFPWSRDEDYVEAWKAGCLGIPLIDAGMRELWQTGTMHNRARMNVASFLTRQLNIHWQVGFRWFSDTLLDADLANNLLGWQWSAGCGADAAPFVRLFNPTLQAARYDPEGYYVRRYLSMPPAGSTRRRSAVKPVTLPPLSVLRAQALARYERWRSEHFPVSSAP